jgi:peptidoglycan hydrolase-like protein with peptidoglycan-binding domain
MSNEYDVTSIQEALTICGFNPGRVDGKMGANTVAAIKAFQKDADLDADGIVGSDTAESLAEYLNEASVKAAELEGYFSGDGSSADDDM